VDSEDPLLRPDVSSSSKIQKNNVSTLNGGLLAGGSRPCENASLTENYNSYVAKDNEARK